MKKIIVLLIICFYFKINAQIPLSTYTSEVSNLKTDSEIEHYWKQLYDLDQITYLQDTKDRYQYLKRNEII